MIKKIFKAVALVSIIGVITRICSFVFRIYLSRKLGAEALGIYQIACSIFVLFACFSSSGLPVTISRKTAQDEARGAMRHSDSMFTTAMIGALIMAVAICLFFVLVPNSLNLLFTDKRCADIFMILLPALISTAVYSIIRAWFWGKKKYLIFSGMELFEELLKIILTVSLIPMCLFGSLHSKTVALAYVIGDFICAIVLIILYAIKGGKPAKPMYLKELTKSAVPITSTRLFGSLVSSAMALLLPSLLVSAGMEVSQATAEFGRAGGMMIPLILAPTTIVGSLAVVIVPELATATTKNGAIAAGRSISKAMIFSAAVTVIFMSVYLAGGKDIGVLLYKDSRAGELILYSAVIMLPLTLNQLSATMLNSLGKENWTFLTNLVSSVILMTLIVILPKYIGIMAYTVALGAYHLVGLVMNVYKIRKTTHVSLSFILDSLILFVLGLLTALAGGYVGSVMRDYSLILRTFTTAIVTCFSYSLALLPVLLSRGRKRNVSL